VRKLQTQGVHHITIVGADRQTSIDFWEGVLGMPFVFEQPNLDNELESHLYFDPGDGRLITVFTNEDRRPDPERTSTDIGCVHHIAFALSQATFHQAVERLDERKIRHSGVKDPRPPDRACVLSLRAALRPHARRCAARGAQDPGGAGRLQHRAGASRGCPGDARQAIAGVPVRRPIAKEPIPLR